MSIKKIVFSSLLLFAFFPLCLLIWSQTYNLINLIDPGVYIRFATDNKNHEDIFLNNEIDKKTKIYETISNSLKNTNFESRKTKQAVYSHMWEYKNIVKKAVIKNKIYMNYLNSKNLNINDFLNYIERMTTLDQTLLNGCFYFTALIEILIFYFLFQYRLRIYLVAFLIYIFSNLNAFTFNIFGNLFYPFLLKYLQFFNDTISYEDYFIITQTFLPTIKEALLTYIIIDVIGQYYRDKKKVRNNYELKKIYYSLTIVIKQLRSINKVNNSITIKKVEIDFYPLYNYCKKNKNIDSIQKIKTIIEDNKDYLLYNSKSLNIELYLKLLENLKKELENSLNIMKVVHS